MEQEYACSMKTSIQKDFIHLSKLQRVYLWFKRGMDVLISSIGLIALIPLFLLVAAAIKWEDPEGSVLYSQDRIGRKGISFRLYKFRSMRTGAPELSTQEFKDSGAYVTKVGKFIRHTSIDELPQLWNVVIGDMSLVGPRPLLSREREVHMMRFHYGLYQVRPGITGMAQTHGRDEMNDADKVYWDRVYVEKISLLTDIYLVWRTIIKVVRREGIAGLGNEAGSVQKSQQKIG